MRTTDYTIELEALKAALHQLDQEELDLHHAMQTYQQGLKHHERCVNTLSKLEQSLDTNVHSLDGERIEPVELSLKEVFMSLENIEHSIEELPESNLEDCIELLVQAERILHAGYHHIDLASELLHSNPDTSIQSAVSSSSTQEVDRV